MKTLTVFTPTYNRLHTLPRTYESLCRQTCKDFDWLVIDDGSSDGTRAWIESLGEKIVSSGQRFDWMGRIEDGEDENHFFIQDPHVRIEYVYKPNGGLYTGYNVAYQTIQTELCVCVDSDDFMPDDAVEKILNRWKQHYPDSSCDHKFSALNQKEYCGVVGLDFNVADKKPIGGNFPKEMREACALEIPHVGDTKYAFRTELMRKVAPQIGFEGERDFNPHYMQMQVLDKMPILLLNENLCWVEYQIGADSMSQGIFKQYVRSPKSYAIYRLMEMQMSHCTFIRKAQLCIHYASACILSKDKDWLKKSPEKLLTLLAYPFGWLLTFYIKKKAKV